MTILSPSILAADFADLGNEIRATVRGGAQYLHIDVMDGVFVPQISIGMPVLKSVRAVTNQTLDVHLMIVEPERYIEEFAAAGADIITFHLEATKDPEQVIDKIRVAGKKVGISIKPGTPLDEVKPYLSKVDMVLIMTVEPGFGGQKYIPATTEKIKMLRDWIEEKKLPVDLEVDGGINEETLKTVLDAGANVIVAGSAVFKNDPETNTKQLRNLMDGRL